jgi:hypothetical protein
VPRDRRFLDSAWGATAIYAILAVATTWPLVLHLTRSLPIDQGDSLLNCWILSWNADHLLAWFWGNASAFQDYWNPPIFHPAPLALAYSEHLFAESLQIAPIYGISHNIFLCYNLLVLSTYVLSALGMYLLARELTRDAYAAWVAGACYGFALLRLPQLTHLQVLSAQWMPFVLFGLRRYFVSLRADPLGWAAVALVLQNLSCGYYLVFFAPVVVLYCVYEIADRGLWRRWRTWVALAVAASAVTLATWPFLTPYLWLRARGFPPRPIWEVQQFSADVLAALTASSANRAWGWLQAYPRAEGELFAGLVTLLLAGLAIVGAARELGRSSADFRETRPRRRVAVTIVLVSCAVYVAAALLVDATRDPNWRIAGVHFRLGDPWKAWVPAATLAGIALVLSRRLRAVIRGMPGSVIGFFAVLAIGGSVLALGPVISIAGQPTDLPAPYAQLYWHVPGYDGLRVPARFGMVAVLGLAGLAGYGAHALNTRGRMGRRALIALSVLFLVESTGAPIALDYVTPNPGWGTPAPVRLGNDTPDVYRFVSALPIGASLLELPFGVSAWDEQYVFYQHTHRRPIVNGYSGGFPSWYWPTADALADVGADPGLAWATLTRSGASHVIVHRRGYLAPRAADSVETFLSTHGARMIRASGEDRVYALPAS